MPSLLMRAYFRLICFDFYLATGKFVTVYEAVRSCSVSRTAEATGATEKICSAVDLACVWYWKEVRCLQRSAATAYLLKRHGVPAQMIIGAQQVPFKAHAWVEVGGRVVNDKPYMREIYGVLDQC